VFAVNIRKFFTRTPLKDTGMDSAGLGRLLEPGGDVDALAVADLASAGKTR
jgi:hypothetical protein